MDKNKFWLGGRLFNTASPRLGTPTQRKARPQVGRRTTQRKARPQVGRPNALTQGTSASWAPQRTSQRKRKGRPHVRKLGTPTQHKAHPQDGRPNAKLIHNENVHIREHWAKRRDGGWIRTNFGLEVDFLIRPPQVWAPQRNARHVHKMGAQTQHKARPQVGHPNATQGTFCKLGAPMQTQGISARPEVGHSNAMKGTSVRWLLTRKTHPQRKLPHKGAPGLKTRWRMDKNKFCLGGRIFNTASPRIGSLRQCKACPQDGRPNEMQGDFARWSPK
jgi:hypothetical protein